MGVLPSNKGGGVGVRGIEVRSLEAIISDSKY